MSSACPSRVIFHFSILLQVQKDKLWRMNQDSIYFQHLVPNFPVVWWDSANGDMGRKTEDRDWRYSGYGTCYTWPTQVQFPVPYMVPQATPEDLKTMDVSPQKKQNADKMSCYLHPTFSLPLLLLSTTPSFHPQSFKLTSQASSLSLFLSTVPPPFLRSPVPHFLLFFPTLTLSSPFPTPYLFASGNIYITLASIASPKPLVYDLLIIHFK